MDATKTTIGANTGASSYTNRAELADINGDRLVDILFANGGNYDMAGEPEFSQVFLNQVRPRCSKRRHRRSSAKPACWHGLLVRDVNADSLPDILVGTTFQTQSQLYLGDDSGNFTNVTKRIFPRSKPASVIWSSAMWTPMGPGCGSGRLGS